MRMKTQAKHVNGRRRLQPLRLLKLRLAFILAIAAPNLGVSSCSTTPPAIDAQQWLGSSKGGSVISSTDQEVKCTDPAFDQFGCYTLQDMERIWTTVYGCCERWSKACVVGAQKGAGAEP